jgi:hypothetical protein
MGPLAGKNCVDRASPGHQWDVAKCVPWDLPTPSTPPFCLISQYLPKEHWAMLNPGMVTDRESGAKNPVFF